MAITYRIECNRNDGLGWVDDGCWGGEYATGLSEAEAHEAIENLRELYPDVDWRAEADDETTGDDSDDTCNCTQPYSMHVESTKENVSSVDGYGNPLRGCRRVTRCKHGREMKWDGQNWRTD